MSVTHDIEKIPGLKELLRKCQDDVAALTGIPVHIFYRIKFHHLSTSDLIRIVCDVCEVTWQQMLSDSRKAHYVIARQLFCYFAYKVQKKSLTIIGQMLGRDHTTVIHAREKVETMKHNGDDLYMVPYNEIERRIDELMVKSISEGATPKA